MKKEGKVVSIVIIILIFTILSTSVVSATMFGNIQNFFNKLFSARDTTITGFQVQNPNQSSGGPVAYYKFEGDMQDSSGNNNHGTLFFTSFVNGKSGQASSYNGVNSSVNLLNSDTLNIAGDITIGAWVYRKSNTPMIPINKYYHYAIKIDNQGRLSWADGTYYSFTDFGYYGFVPMNEWHYITVTKSVSNVTIYMDGNIVISRKFGGSLTSKTSIPFIGSYSNYTSPTTGANMNGHIDEMKIWNRALTQSEILSEYNNYNSCTPLCAGKQCGSDGCSGSCGTCTIGQTCNNGSCVSSCIPKTCSELGKKCGSWSDGCSSTINCGTCAIGQTCSSNGTCLGSCIPSCAGKTCGSDGCSGSCGTCPQGQTCNLVTGTCNSDLKAHYKFEGNFLDSSGNNNHGTPYSTGFGSNKNGQYSTYNGRNSYMKLVNSDSLNIVGDITIGSWVYRTSNTPMIIINKFYHYSIKIDNQGRLSWADSSYYSFTDFGYYGFVPLNEWHYITVTKKGSNVTIFMDGNIVISRKFGDVLKKIESIPFIGTYSNYTAPTAGAYMNGSIDEMKIWNRALTQSEILNEYNNYNSCTPLCAGKTCGSDGCGGSCGTCSSGMTCNNNGSCIGSDCGFNTYNSTLLYSASPPGTIPILESVSKFYSNKTTAQKLCELAGDASLRYTDNSSYSSPTDNYVTVWNGTGFKKISAVGNNFWILRLYCNKKCCTPNPNTCLGKQCGSDGCGGSCGTCVIGQTCNNGSCVESAANATISIATLKDSYTVGEQIKITDPPEEGIINNIIQKSNNRIKEQNNINNNNNDITNFDSYNEKVKDNNGNIKFDSKNEQKSKGYIIEFSDKPIIVKDKELKDTAKSNELKIRSKSVIDPTKYIYSATLLQEKDLDKKLSDYKQQLKTNREKTKLRIYDKLHNTHLSSVKPSFFNNILKVFTGNVVAENTNPDLKVISEWDSVYNGVALDISSEEAKKIKDVPGVKSVTPNLEVKANLMDSVPLIGADKVWQMDSDGNNCQISGKECLTGKNVRIAIIDTGVDYTHLDLGGCFGNNCKVIGGYDFVNNDNDPMDDQGHGTHVAGIAAGNGNGGLKGVAPDAKIYAYKVLNSEGSGYNSWIISGIERAVDPNSDGDYSDHLDIISLSLGGDGNPDDSMSTAIDNAVSKGVVAVIAAGNSGPRQYTIGSPGTSRKAITVGATYKKDYLGEYFEDFDPKKDQITSFSSRGPVRWPDSNGVNQYLIKPDIVAPGALICSARYDSIFSEGQHPYYKPCLDEKHIQLAGTSMATPIVAGSVALLKQKHPDWSPDEIKSAIKSTTKDLGDSIFTQGAGGINVLSAVNLKGKPGIADIYTKGEIGGIIDVLGTASGKDFKNYILYYGIGLNPIDWYEISRGYQKVENGILLHNFDTISLSDGTIILKLVVFNSFDEISVEKSIIEVNNVELTNPQVNDVLRAGDIIPIEGKILLNDEFKVEYGIGKTPDRWYDNNIKLSNNGHGPYIGNIALFDTSSLESNFYTIKLSIIKDYKTIRTEIINYIYLDKSLEKGWPKTIDFKDTKGMWAGFLVPVVYDLDNDGNKEIIVFRGGYPPTVLVYDNNGVIKFVRSFGNKEVPGGNLPIPLVGDIDNDGFGEIIAFNLEVFDKFSSLTAINHDNTTLWEVLVPSDYHPTLLMYDLNGDGKKEIVIKGNDSPNRFVTILDNKGQIISNWKLDVIGTSSSIASSPAIGNFDNDNDYEIVIAGPSKNDGPIFKDNNFIGWVSEGTMSIYNLDGSVLKGWPITLPGPIFSSPVVGDINNDGSQEIIISLGYNSIFFGNTNEYYGGVYAFKSSGEILKGWPVLKGQRITSTPSLADIDNDNNLEVVVSTDDKKTFLIDTDGSIKVGWPQKTNWIDSYSTIVGDVNGDNQPDILTTIGSGFYPSIIDHDGVYAWNKDGSIIDNFPKVTDSDTQAPLVIDDIDDDNIYEIIASSDSDLNKNRGSIYVWEAGKKYTNVKPPWPMFMHDTQLTGCYDCDKNLLQTSRPQSRLDNYGNSSLNGQLLIILQKSNNVSWTNVRTVVNSTITIPIRGLIKLDIGKDNLGNQVYPGFNNLNVSATSSGDYRVYVRFDSNNKYVEDSWKFKVQ